MSISEGKKQKEKRVVIFDGKVEIHEIFPNVYKLSAKQKADVWFNQDDFKRMKDADRLIIRQLRVGGPVPSDARGLESRSPMAFMERRVATMDGIAAVLGEQSRQRSLGQMDEESIRSRYICATRELVSEAITRGTKDAEDAQAVLDGGVDISNENSTLVCDATVASSKQLNRGSLKIFSTRKTLQHILSRATKTNKRQEPSSSK